MNNNAPIDPAKLPKTLQPFAGKITDFEDDRGNQNGYWVYLAAGWWSEFNGSHTIHEGSLSLCRSLVREAVRCQCAECKNDLAVTKTPISTADAGRLGGKKGGLAKGVKKGLAALSEERKKEISKAGVEARRKARKH